jgi:hypothetical protein
MNPHYSTDSRRAGRRCEYCKAPEIVSNFGFEIDHIDPVSNEGTHEIGNLSLACRACNSRKRDRRSALDEQTGMIVSLFHPRNDRWQDHFRHDLEKGTILGLTSCGRATVSALDLNHPQQISARFLWMKYGLFPG